MANSEVKAKGSKAPSRAASLQRMLEIERKQKVSCWRPVSWPLCRLVLGALSWIERLLTIRFAFSSPQMERMQQNSPASPSGRRGASPASFSSANSKPSLLTRRRDSSLPRDDHRISNARSYTLPPLSVHTESTSTISLAAKDKPTKPSKEAHNRSASVEPATTLNKELKKLDRDTLPSMTRTANVASPNMRTVTFLPSDDGHDSDDSSICHSPTWDDYGKKKKKEKDADQRRKRLTKKEPPPAAMDNRPELNLRAMSDPILTAKKSRPSLDSLKAKSVLPLTNAQTEVTSVSEPRQTTSVETVETMVRSPAFIGGVRLEREREAALKRLMNSRAPSSERPVSEVLPTSNQTKTDALKKRETAPASPHYPPTASKTPYLAQSQPSKGHNRKRTGSIGSGLISSAAKIFQSRDKELQPDDLTLQRNRSRESVSSIQSLFASAFERGRQMGDFASTAGRTRSTEAHGRNSESSSKEGGKRGGLGLPPLSWKNKRRERTASMMAVPPDSARDATFPSDENTSKLKQDNFSFLERPFSPGLSAPLSPPASVSASLKAKMSPQLSPTPQPLSQPPKKTLKETLKAGLRSSLPPERPQNQRSHTDPSANAEFTLPRDSHPLQSHPLPKASKNKIKGVAYEQLPSPATQPRLGPDSKYSGASSSSSHPDSESQPSSPMTSPDTSRPQSAKENQIFRLEDLKKALQNQTNGQVASRPIASMLPVQSSPALSTPKSESQRTNVESKSKAVPVDSGKQVKVRESNFVEDFQASQAYLSDESWSQTKKPLDPDQLSFTSALTSLDVKRSIQDLNSVLESPNADVEPFSLDKDQKAAAANEKKAKKHVRLDLAPTPANRRKPQTHGPQGSSSANGYQPYRPSTTTTAKAGHLSSPESDQRSATARTRTDSPESYAMPSSKASAYLQEARKAAPSSPRGPASSSSKPTAGSSSSHTSSPLGSPLSSSSRTFALAAPSSHKSSLSTSALATSSTAMANHSPLATGGPVTLSSSDGSKILGKPIAKMLVECCHCRFYQDMPSRVYEAMARPDDVIKDARLGVSGSVTTCVKCPWCAHNMSTACCAGYAAVVYLKEKLHGI